MDIYNDLGYAVAEVRRLAAENKRLRGALEEIASGLPGPVHRAIDALLKSGGEKE